MSSEKIRDLMTKDPIILDRRSSVSEAARQMKSSGVGDVLVMDEGKLCGIVTDRDIVVRCIAEDADPLSTEVGSLCTEGLVTVAPSDDADKAVVVMKEHAVRRLPVVENGKAVGIISIGDLAVERSSHSALGQISAALPNN